jgi:crotonobetainyl-CoA:carnitine CoA-transferase CaiB-like acyl-CoA transferase
MTALEGVRVIDFSEGLAAALVGMFFSDFGANVVKVERPEGDPSREEPGFAAWNRGKASVTVALESEVDLVWLSESMRGADVCVLGAGQKLADWGPGIEEAAAANSRLVVVAMPAYVADGAPWLGERESNALLSAYAGVSWRQSSDDGSPVEPIYPHLLYVQGVWGTVCAVSALLEREKSGFGQKVTVSGINAVMVASVASLSVDPNAPDPGTAVGGVGRHPTYRPVRAADKWLASGALGPKFETALLGKLGIEHILDDPRLGGKVQAMVRPENMAWSMEQISAAFRTKPRDYWLSELAAEGIPTGPLLERDDWLDHPQVIANGLRAELDDPERGHVIMSGVPLALTLTPGSVRQPAPSVGQDNGAVPWPPQAQPEGKPSVGPGPLSNYRILDMGTFVASPYAGFLLAELGADVIKVEPPTGDPFRGTGFSVNRGMRSFAINLASVGGRALFRKLSADADVLIDGMRPGVMKKLGIDYESLREVNPDIVTTSLSAFGPHGDLAQSGGVDMVVQAMSGMMLAQGEDDRPVSNTMAIIDVTTACISALASVLALFHRERSGEGQRTWDSLVGTSTYLQLGELVRYAGRVPALRGGTDFKGYGPLDRYYPVSDGWVRIQAPGDQPGTVDRLKEVGLVVEEISVEHLSRALSALTGTEVVDRLATVGIPAVRARRVSELFLDEQLRANEFTHFRPADDGSVLATPARYATFSRTQRSGPLTPPGVGEHSRELLLEAGMTDAEIDDALAQGIVVQGGRNPVLLGAIYR